MNEARSLREAMRARLERLAVSGVLRDDDVNLLRSPPRDRETVIGDPELPTVADVIARRFETMATHYVLELVAPELQAAVLERPTLLAELWPLNEELWCMTFGCGNAWIDAPPSGPSVTIPGTTIALHDWPARANPLEVFEWMASRTTGREIEWVSMAGKNCLAGLDRVRAGQPAFADVDEYGYDALPEWAREDPHLADERFFATAGMDHVCTSTYAAVFEADRNVRERLRSDASECVTFAHTLLAELARDEPRGAKIRASVIDDAARIVVGKTPTAPIDDRARNALDRELRLHVELLRERLDRYGYMHTGRLTDPDPYVWTVFENDGMLAWDAQFASYLETLGEYGKSAAGEVRDAARGRFARLRPGASAPPVGLWHLWADANTSPVGCRFARALAIVLWHDVVGPQLERERVKPPALVRPVMVAALDFHARGRDFDERTGQLSFAGDTIATIAPIGGAAVDLEVLRFGLGALGSVVAHKLFRWEVFTGHRQWLDGVQMPHVIEIPGGWTALAEALGLNPEKWRHPVRALVYTQAHAQFTYPDGSRGNLLVYNEKDARGRHERARVRIELGSPLLPGYDKRLLETMGRASLESRTSRKLVPLPRTLPPLVGRQNEHGQQLTFSHNVMVALRDRARELVTYGGAKLTFDNFTSLADRSSLPRRMLVTVREAWLRGGPDAPPFLAEVDRDRYTLADAHRAEREFLEAGGRDELDGAEAGKRGVGRHRAEVRRRAGKRRK